MSAFERMKQVRTLLVTGIDYTGNIDYSRLINESRNRCFDIINKRHNFTFITTKIRKDNELGEELSVKNVLDLSDDCNKNLQDHFKSMLKLTSYLFYDRLDLNESAVSIKPNKCIFELDEKEITDLEYFASEIDAIQDDLIDINTTVKKLQENYRTYCENFLRLCDQKDALFDMYLDYYEEYFINDQCQPNAAKASKPKRKKTSSICKSAEKTSKSRKGSEKSEHENEARDLVSWEDEESNETIERIDMPKKSKSNLARRKSSIYMYGVPTENRFSILSKTEKGTFIKHY